LAINIKRFGSSLATFVPSNSAGRRKARDEIIDLLLWYNRERRHSTLVFVSPMKFERDWLGNKPRQANS